MKNFTINITNDTTTYTYHITASNIFTAERIGIDTFIREGHRGIISLETYEDR